jgi:hypothetical protein
LVTFIACEIVTGGRITEILGSDGSGFQPARRHRRGGVPQFIPMPPRAAAPQHEPVVQSVRDLNKLDDA